MGQKILVTIGVVVAFIAYEFATIPVPSGSKEPFPVRLVMSVFKLNNLKVIQTVVSRERYHGVEINTVRNSLKLCLSEFRKTCIVCCGALKQAI